MSFKLERGLFKYDFIDYHAILCVRVDADASEIRKRYLQIARRLHPDSCAKADDEEKRLASELLSKLVNPAYEHLHQEKNHAEHNAVLVQIAKRLAQDSSVELTTDNARQLASTPNYESAYKNAISHVAKIQYNSLAQAVEAISQISELNLVYLMRSAGKSLKSNSSSSTVSGGSNTNNTAAAGNNSAPPQPKEDPVFAGYMRRAQELIVKNQLSQARVELQDAIKMKPSSNQCHSLIGVVYMKQNQIKMAKIHFDRALQLDPKDATALEGKAKIDKFLKKTAPSTGKKSTVSAAASKSSKSESGGLFGGLFGGKKK
ncbi:DnaJ domain-containing protein [Calothrix sp. CCY 0018]|uniref:J domain-containing protein n=1 Tax=Calothrix sp. CCY 0018 TaxID=3103864 RepID=UPI0039C6C536